MGGKKWFYYDDLIIPSFENSSSALLDMCSNIVSLCIAQEPSQDFLHEVQNILH